MRDNISLIIDECVSKRISKLDKKTKSLLDNITDHYDNSRSPLKALVAACFAKLLHKKWDIRYHQVQIGGMFSLRSFDTRYVCPELYKRGLYNTPTTFALTRSFEKSEPYTCDYTGNIKPLKIKESLLSLISIINDNKKTKTVLSYFIHFLNNQKNNLIVFKDEVKKVKISLESLRNLLNYIVSLHPGGSVLPVITVHTCCEVAFKNINIIPLKHHNASDKQTKSLTDIEGYYMKVPKLAIEIKYNNFV